MDRVQRQRLFEGIQESYGSRRRGKIFQRLLLLTFYEAGYRVVEEGISEGLDIEVEDRNTPQIRYALEVRTTQRPEVQVKEQDLQQMDKRPAGYRTALAAIRTRPASQWVFIERSRLLPGLVRVSHGTSPDWAELALRINRSFDPVLEEFGPLAISEGLGGLEDAVKRVLSERQGPPNEALHRTRQKTARR